MRFEKVERDSGWRAKADSRAALFCWAMLAGFFLLQFRSIYTETINWDEFALLSRARQSLDTGSLMAGGRPGLATVLLMPIVKHAANEVDAVHAGRIVWFLFTLIFILGTYFYLKAVLKTDWRILPFFGTAVLIMNPLFIRCAVQIRTDQIALAFSILACICLLQRAPGWHMLAGILFAAGFLSTQKALYVMGIGLVVSYLRPLVAGNLRVKHHGLRLILFAAAFGFAVMGWQIVTSVIFSQATFGHSVKKQLDVFDFYSRSIGYKYYIQHLRFWIVHLILGVVVLTQVAFHICGRKRFPPDLIVATGVLLAGTGVGIFHKAAFPYFLMVLGLFPAIGFSLSLKSLSEMFPEFHGKATAQTFCLSVLFLSFLGLSLPHILMQQEDTQKAQRESLSFVRNNFYGRFEGFQPEGALFLQPARSQFKIYLAQHISKEFGTRVPEQRQNIEAFIRKFYDDRVGYLVRSYRMDQFPNEIRTFWNSHYIPWKGAVYLAGAFLNSKKGMKQSVDLVVSGRYIWVPDEMEMPIRIDGSVLGPYQLMELRAGAHVIDFGQVDVHGRLVLESRDSACGRFHPVFYCHGFTF